MVQQADTEAELVSALADDQLQGEEFARTVDWLAQDEQARLRWHAYHVVGDVLRMGSAASAAGDADFLQNLRLRLQQQAPLPPRRSTIELIAVHDRSTKATARNDAITGHSNQPRFGARWALGVAALAVTALVAWQLLGDWGGPSEVPQLAQTLPSAPVVQQLAVGEASQPMIRDPQLDALLAAHRQFGGTSALQGSAGFLRNATFDGSSR